MTAVPKVCADFDDQERAVIRERRRYQDAATLALVFCTTPRVIGILCRKSPVPE